jgi:hypothetical protein
MKQMSSDEEADRIFSNELRRYGFESGELVREVYPAFVIADLAASLFCSRESKPRTIEVHDSDDKPIRIAVTAARQVFVPAASRDLSESGPADDWYEYPEWLAEGWIVSDERTVPTTSAVKVRLYVQVARDKLDTAALLQTIPANPDPNGIILMSEL